MSVLQVRFFGTGQIQTIVGEIVPLRNRKQLALLAYLLVEKRYAHSRDSLLALFWRDHNTDKARNNLRVALSQLRKLTTTDESKSPLILATKLDVQINPNIDFEVDFWLDGAKFEEQLQQTRTHTHTSRKKCADCQPHLEEAVALYKGEFLAGLSLKDSPEFEEWLFIQRERYHLLTLDTYADLATFAEQQTNFDEALYFVRQQINLDGLREPAYRQQMRILAKQGERNRALAAFERCRKILHDELGVDPDAETLALRNLILEDQIVGAKRSDVAESLRRDEVLTRENRARRSRSHSSGAHSSKSSTAPLNKSTLNKSALNKLTPLPKPLTSIIGRKSESETVMAMVQNPTTRLVTVVGLGGVGKTQLALAVAHQLEATFHDGACFVELASAENDKIALISTIARSFNLPLGIEDEPEAPLLTHLASRQLLLVLDNYEQLVDETELLLQIQQHAPDVTILLTSRVRVNLSSETPYLLSGLAVPPAGWQPIEIDRSLAIQKPVGNAALQPATAQPVYGAVELFLSIANRLQPDFVLGPDNFAAIARICQLVSGVPLGLELAAGWIRMLSCDEIVAELENSLDILATTATDRPERQRNMHRIFDYTWGMLSTAEKLALMRLTYFRGGFDRDAASTVARSSLTMLAILLDKSLLQRTESGRYTLHELVRQFSIDKLRQVQSTQSGLRAEESLLIDDFDIDSFGIDDFDLAGLPLSDAENLDGMAAAHSAYYLQKIGEVGELLEGPTGKEWLPKLRREDGNSHHALHYAVYNGPIERLQEALRSSIPYYRVNGRYLEISQLLGHAIERIQRAVGLHSFEPHALATMMDDGPKQLLCEVISWLMIQLANTFNRTAKYHEAIELAKRAITIAERIELPQLLIEAYVAWGGALGYMSDATTNVPLERALEIARSNQQPTHEPKILGMLGLYHFKESQFAEAHSYYEQVLQMARQNRDWKLESLYLVSLGWLFEREGNFEDARCKHEEGYAICKKMDFRTGEARALQGLGIVAVAQWALHDAAQKHGRAIAIAIQLYDRQREAANRYHLGRAFFISGNEVKAREHLETTIDISREIDDSLNESLALSHLGYVEMMWGSEAKAEQHFAQALSIGSALENIESMSAAHQGLGWLKLQQADPVAAEAHFETDLLLKQEWEQLYAIIDPQTGLVQAALDQGMSERAEELCDPILAFLESETPHGSTWIGYSFFACYQVLLSQRKPEAEVMLQAARTFLYTVAERFPEKEEQMLFLENIPVHQKILAA